MSDDSVKEAQKKDNNHQITEIPEEKRVEPSIEPISTERLDKEIKDEAIARVLSEVFRNQQQFASIYVDNRSGGVFFSSDATITGDVIGRNQSKQKTGTSGQIVDINFTRVSKEVLTKLNTVYVTPSLYSQTQRILSDKHLVIFQGQAHWGKWSTAVHLLSVLHNNEIFEINPDITLKELQAYETKTNRGYIIDTLTSDSSEKLKGHVIKSLSNKFKDLDSHLIITVDSRASLFKEDLSSYLIIWNEVPNRTQMLEKHLVYYLTTSDLLTKALELSQSDAVKQLLNTSLLPSEVDRLAELLSMVVHHKLELEEALARFEARAQQQVEAWFDAHPNLEQRTFMLSLAVFNGANYDIILNADQSLQAFIRPNVPKTKSSDNDSAFGDTRSRRLKDANAQIKKGYIETEYGSSPMDIVTFNNPSFQPAVLRFVWQEYDRLHQPLLEWLRDFGYNLNYDIRTRAAAAIGALSRYNFHYVREVVLLPWAKDDDRRVRTSAALALGIPAWEGEFASQVLGLLHHWSTLRDNWRLCWTAAAAYGGLVGLRFPDSALRDLYSIAQAEDLRLLGVLNASIINFFRAGRLFPDYYFKVLDALLAWAKAPKIKLVNLISLNIFSQLALEDRIEIHSSNKLMPTILWIAQQNEVYLDRVISLWRQALNNKVIRESALEALRQWLTIADNDDQLYLPIEHMITLLISKGTDREKERLYFYLNRWATNPKHKSESADKILTKLYYK